MKRSHNWVFAFVGLFRGFAILVIALGVGFLSCGKKSPTASQGDVQISPSVVVLPDSTMTYLHHQDSTNYYFTKGTKGTQILSTLKSGNIIVSGYNEGLLRTVTGVSEDQTFIIVQTSEARLDEVILQGGLNTEFTLSPQALVKANSIRGVTLSPQGGNFYITYEDTIWHDPSGSIIKITGNTTFSPTVKFGVHWNHGVDTLGAGLTVGQTSSATLTATGAMTLLDKNITFATLRFHPIVIMVGPVPVVIVPQLKLILGANASVQEGITTSAVMIDTIRGGIIYKQKTWYPYSGYSQSFSYNPPQLSLTGDAKGYVLIPKLELLLYGSVGPNASFEGYERIHADQSQNPWWRFYAGLSADAGVETNILGLVVAGYQVTLFEKEWEIANSGGGVPPPAPALSSPADGATNVPINPTTLTWNASSGATSYRIQVATDAGFGNLVVDQANISSTTYSVNGLLNNTLYYWHANASNQYGTSGWSSTWSFTTEVNSGLGWVSLNSGTTSDLNGVHFPVDAQTGYAVGGWFSSTILKTTDGGANWVSQVPGTSNDLASVQFPLDASTGYTVGRSGTILKTTDGGANWVSQTSGTSNFLQSVHFPVNASTGYAVGEAGTILKTTDGGAVWNTLTSGTTNYLLSVYFPVDASTGYAMGYTSTILKTTDGGANWVSQPSGTTADFYGVHFPVDAQTGYAVGGYSTSTILKTTDGGAAWVSQTSGTSMYLQTVQFPVDASTGYVVVTCPQSMYHPQCYGFHAASATWGVSGAGAGPKGNGS